MANVHIISDLYLEYNENSESEQILPPETDLVIFNGNIGKHIKRGFLYIETMCKLYPEVQFVVNPGSQELYATFDKFVNEVYEGLILRRDNNANWPRNLHFNDKSMIITLKNGTQVDVLCQYGFPYIHSCHIDWEDTTWFRNHCKEIVYGLDQIEPHIPSNTSRVLHGAMPIFATMQDINLLHRKELDIVRQWETTPTVIKILVTHINPYKDSRCDGCKVTPYNIHLEKGYWIGSDTPVDGVLFMGSQLYSNPGRGVNARSKVFKI